ncbi:hypothetical protein OYT1_ch0724 [Ferriphaselus amnicola]|uniref:Uncharacterized protein n=1 Tax=Ferriphaselus amnicola TaxID=1188319 RepID=A0A2Z6G9W2_9PROT|nr:hypothetical protein OYT1_ch0724 [Ferriphaselus amnicola]
MLMYFLLYMVGGSVAITIRGVWIEGILAQVFAFCIIGVYLHFFPKIIIFRRQYVISQAIGVAGSLLAYVFPDLDILLAMIYVVAVLVLIIPISNELGRILSK